jgi:hypothetical protein
MVSWPRLLVVLPMLLALSACSTRQPLGAQALSGEEIERLFRGRSFTLVGMKSGNELVAYAAEEYCSMRYTDGERVSTVRWYTRNDQHCCIKKGEERCGRILDMGNGVYHKIIDGEHTQTMQRFEAGNRL